MKEKNYIIDLPLDERWSDTVTVRCDNYLKDRDMLRLPSGSWLEITQDTRDCFGSDSLQFGRLEVLIQTDEIDRDIDDKRKEGRVYKTEATYIR